METLRRLMMKLMNTRAGWLAKAVVRRQIQRGAQISFSQEGEDLLIDRYFRYKKTGYYIDVGAHHPTIFSNTWRFYSRGWSGINIDPLPGTSMLFNRTRPRDHTFEVGIARTRGELVYHKFAQPALSTFDENLANQREKEGWKKDHTITIEVTPLGALLANEIPDGTEIDFMTVDVEGLDLEVLASNDWDRFRPRLVVVEILDSDMAEVMESPVAELLRSQGYRLISKLYYSCVFERFR